jgi:dTMP kinase
MLSTDRGKLIAIEGLNGVGKTYLTDRLITATTHRGMRTPHVIEEFSRRTGAATDLGRRLLRTLIDAADGEYFLRGGFSKSETLLLLAIKMHDYETARPALLAGETVIEGRSVHSTAVYQSLILEPHDNAAAQRANQILTDTARWRPLPDLTIVLTDDVATAVRRAETRDRRRFTAEQLRLLHRAARLFEQLTTTDPQRVRLLDRRAHDPAALVEIMTTWIAEARAQPFAGPITVPS